MKRAVVVLACVLVPTGCTERNSDIQSEIDETNKRISVLEDKIEIETAASGSLRRDIVTRIDYGPAIAWSKKFNSLPPVDRTIWFRQTSAEGQIAKDDWDCGLFGRGGWYVEFNGPNVSEASALVGPLSIAPRANEIRLVTPLAVRVRTQLHWHFDPCIGGGFGGSVGVSAAKNFINEYQIQFKEVQDSKLNYSIAMVQPRDLSITIEVHLGRIGKLGIPINLTNLASSLGSGSVDLGFVTGGVVGPLPDGRKFDYAMETVSPAISSDSRAIEASTDLGISITPKN